MIVMKPTDLASPEDWRGIQRLIAQVTGLTAVTFDLSGTPIAQPEFQNEYCSAVKATGTGADKCAASHKRAVQAVMASGKPAVETCSAGLVKVVVPVKFNVHLIGVTGGCGVYFADEGLDDTPTIELARACGIDDAEAERLINTIRGIDRRVVVEEIDILESKLEAMYRRLRVA